MKIFSLFGEVFIENDKAKQSLDEIEKKGEKTAGRLGKIGSSIGRFGAMAGAALAGVGVAIAGAGVAIGKVGIGFNAMMEQSKIAWETLLGGAEEAETMIKDLQTMGAKTPFEFEGLDKSAKLLKAMGVESENLIPYLTNIGDAVSAIGGSQETLEGVSMAIGQMLTKGKVSAEEMNQLAERGIPAWELMAEKLGMSKQELMDLSSQGKIYADEAIPALMSAIEEEFGGAMEKQSQTFNGQMSTLKDNLQMIMGQIAGPIFDIIKKAMPTVIEAVDQFGQWVNENMPRIQEFIENTFSRSGEVLSGFGQVFMWLKDNIIVPVLDFLVPFIQGTVEAISNYWAENGEDIKQTVQTVFDFIKLVVDTVLPYVVDIFKTTWNTIGVVIESIIDIVSGVIKILKGIFTGDWKLVWEGAKQIVVGIIDGVTGIVKGGINLVIGAINNFIKGLNKIKFDVPDWVPGLGGKNFGINIPLIPKLATGTDWFEGGVAIVGEQGPELVHLPRGAAVDDNTETEMALNRSVPEILNNYIVVDGRVMAEVTTRPLRDRTSVRGRGQGVLNPT